MLQFQLVSLVGAVIQFLLFVVCFYFAASLMGQSAQNSAGGMAAGDWLMSVKVFLKDPPDLGYAMYAAQLVGIGAATGWNFVANLFWTWGDAKPTLNSIGTD